jgi:hypothetical protein
MYKYKYKYKYGSVNSSDLDGMDDTNLHHFHINQLQSITVLNNTLSVVTVRLYTRRGSTPEIRLTPRESFLYEFSAQDPVLVVDAYDGIRVCAIRVTESEVTVSTIMNSRYCLP